MYHVDQQLPKMPILPIVYLFPNFTILNFILKFTVAKGGNYRKTWHEILTAYVAIYTSVKSLHEIFADLSQSDVISPQSEPS